MVGSHDLNMIHNMKRDASQALRSCNIGLAPAKSDARKLPFTRQVLCLTPWMMLRRLFRRAEKKELFGVTDDTTLLAQQFRNIHMILHYCFVQGRPAISALGINLGFVG
jgi:hypothetical protein